MATIVGTIEKHFEIQIQRLSELRLHTTTAMAVPFAPSCYAHFAIQPDSTEFWIHDLVISTGVRFMAATVQLDVFQRVHHA
jgi:hypothetical protein